MLFGILRDLKGSPLTCNKYPWTAADAWPGNAATIDLSYNLKAELSCLPAVAAGIIYDSGVMLFCHSQYYTC